LLIFFTTDILPLTFILSPSGRGKKREYPLPYGEDEENSFSPWGRRCRLRGN